MSQEQMKTIADKICLKLSQIPKPHYRFEPLQIRFQLGNGVMLSYPWIMLDGLIAHVAYENLLGDLWDAIPLRMPLPLTEWFPLPFAKETFDIGGKPAFFYKASCSRFEHPETYGTVLYKQLAVENFGQLRVAKTGYDKIRGEFKSYAMEMRCNPSHYCDFYCMGDREHLENWCKGILGLGKKRAIGFGKVLAVEISNCDYDQSIFFGLRKILNRPIPIEFDSTWKSPIALLAYRPPYWAKENHRQCYVPGGFD